MTDDSLTQDTGVRGRCRPTRSTTCATRSRRPSTPTTARSRSTRGTSRTRSSRRGARLPRHRAGRRPRSPTTLLEHLRYPEDLFKVQRYQFARYHVTDAERLLPGQRPVGGPGGPVRARTSYQPPYRLFVDDADGRRRRAWSLTSVYVPLPRTTWPSFVSVDSDATSDDYGKITVLAAARTSRRRARAWSPTSSRPATTSRRELQAFNRGDDRADVRQPADAAGRRRADVRPAGLRHAAARRRRATRSCSSCSCPTATRSASATRWSRRSHDVARRRRRSPVEPTRTTPEPATGRATSQQPTGTRRRADRRAAAARPRRAFDAADRAYRQGDPVEAARQPSAPGLHRGRGRAGHDGPTPRLTSSHPALGDERRRAGDRCTPDLGRPSPRPVRLVFTDAGWSSSVARWAHNPEVAGSNPAPATKFRLGIYGFRA